MSKVPQVFAAKTKQQYMSTFSLKSSDYLESHKMSIYL
jgi:hypothetical protein